MPRPVSVDELKGALGSCARCVDEGKDPLPLRWPPATNRTGPEVRRSVTPFFVSEGQQFGGNDPEETRRAFRYPFQAFKRPTFRQGGQRRSGDGEEARPIQGRRQAMSPADRRRFANLARWPNARPRPVRSRPRARTPPRRCGSTAPRSGSCRLTSPAGTRRNCRKPGPRSSFSNGRRPPTTAPANQRRRPTRCCGSSSPSAGDRTPTDPPPGPERGRPAESKGSRARAEGRSRGPPVVPRCYRRFLLLLLTLRQPQDLDFRELNPGS
jgi:hypothetical protein